MDAGDTVKLSQQVLGGAKTIYLHGEGANMTFMTVGLLA